jgi:hypothetical protein
VHNTAKAAAAAPSFWAAHMGLLSRTQSPVSSRSGCPVVAPVERAVVDVDLAVKEPAILLLFGLGMLVAELAGRVGEDGPPRVELAILQRVAMTGQVLD